MWIVWYIVAYYCVTSVEAEECALLTEEVSPPTNSSYIYANITNGNVLNITVAAVLTGRTANPGVFVHPPFSSSRLALLRGDEVESSPIVTTLVGEVVGIIPTGDWELSTTDADIEQWSLTLCTGSDTDDQYDSETHNDNQATPSVTNNVPGKVFRPEPTPTGSPLPVEPAERVVLEDVYRLTGGKRWYNSSLWLSGSPCGVGNVWYGVECGQLGDTAHVIGLQLENNNLAGQFAAINWGAFAYMDTLVLEHNTLTGTLPIINGTNLRVLDVSNNQLYGRVSSSRLQLASLYSLDVSGNMFGDSVPTHWEWEELEWLDISSNQFEGRLPTPNIEVQSKVTHYNSSWNLVTGDISDAFLDAIPDVNVLDMSHNLHTGNMPLQYILGVFTSLHAADLSYNQLSGRLQEFSSPSKHIKHLKYHHNNLGGETSNWLFPASLVTQDGSFNLLGPVMHFPPQRVLPSLQSLNFRNNRFTLIQAKQDVLAQQLQQSLFVLQNNLLAGLVNQYFNNSYADLSGNRWECPLPEFDWKDKTTTDCYNNLLVAPKHKTPSTSAACNVPKKLSIDVSVRSVMAIDMLLLLDFTENIEYVKYGDIDLDVHLNGDKIRGKHSLLTYFEKYVVYSVYNQQGVQTVQGTCVLPILETTVSDPNQDLSMQNISPTTCIIAHGGGTLRITIELTALFCGTLQSVELSLMSITNRIISNAAHTYQHVFSVCTPYLFHSTPNPLVVRSTYEVRVTGLCLYGHITTIDCLYTPFNASSMVLEDINSLQLYNSITPKTYSTFGVDCGRGRDATCIVTRGHVVTSNGLKSVVCDLPNLSIFEDVGFYQYTAQVSADNQISWSNNILVTTVGIAERLVNNKTGLHYSEVTAPASQVTVVPPIKLQLVDDEGQIIPDCGRWCSFERLVCTCNTDCGLASELRNRTKHDNGDNSSTNDDEHNSNNDDDEGADSTTKEDVAPTNVVDIPFQAGTAGYHYLVQNIGFYQPALSSEIGYGYNISCVVMGYNLDTDVYHNIFITVIPGKIKSLYIKTSPFRVTDNVNPLAVQPVIGFRDAVGNVVMDVAASIGNQHRDTQSAIAYADVFAVEDMDTAIITEIVPTYAYIPLDTNGDTDADGSSEEDFRRVITHNTTRYRTNNETVVQQYHTTAMTYDGTLVFDGVFVNGYTGDDFVIVFSVNTTIFGLLQPIFSPTIRVLPCQNDTLAYSVSGTKRCTPCPVGGVCDGTSLINILPSYWADPSVHPTGLVYRCKQYNGNTLDTGERFSRCIGNVRTRQGQQQGTLCEEGYTGQRCSSCDDGWGMTLGWYCTKCRPSVVRVILIVIIGVAYLFVLTCIVLLCMSVNHSSPLTIHVARMFLTHLQLMSRLPDILTNHSPQLLTTLALIQRYSSELTLNTGLVDCMQWSRRTIFIITMVLPAVVALPAIIIQTIRLLLPKPQEQFPYSKEQLSQAQYKGEYRHYMSVPKAVLCTLFVVLHLMLPQLITEASRWLPCINPFQLYTTSASRPMEIPKRIQTTEYILHFGDTSCTAASTKSVQVVALVMLITYSVISTILPLVVVTIARLTSPKEVAIVGYGYLYGGFVDTFFWWEMLVVNSRKILLVIIATQLENTHLKITVALCLMVLCYGAHIFQTPKQEFKTLVTLESLSLSCMIFSLLASYFYITESAPKPLKEAATVLPFMYQMFVLSYFLLILLPTCTRRVKTAIAGRKLGTDQLPSYQFPMSNVFVSDVEGVGPEDIFVNHVSTPAVQEGAKF